MGILHGESLSSCGILFLVIYQTCVNGVVTAESEGKCPAYCKCTTFPATNNFHSQGHVVPANDVAGTQFPEKVISDCWIPASLSRLECGLNWKTLHLQILSDAQDASPDSSTGVLASSELFSRCSSLSRLAIWKQSQITHLPQTVFRPLTNLTRLVVTVPTLLTLPDHFLAFLPNINYLMVKECFRLTQLTRSVFKPCPKSLREVELNGNGLNGTLSAGIFQDCDFHTLWLNENQLVGLEYGSLRGLSRLQYLRLDHNRLSGSMETALGYRSEIQSSAISSSTSQLRRLDLSFNRLAVIEGHFWSGVCSKAGLQTGAVVGRRGLCFLEELNLSNNQLHWLGTQAFAQLPRLRKLLLDGNQKLYNSDALASLSVSLYSLREAQKIDTILLSLPSSLNDASPSSRESTLPLVHQLKTFNVCDPNLPHLDLFPRTLKEVLEQLNTTACRGLSQQQTIQLTGDHSCGSGRQQNSKLLGMSKSDHDMAGNSSEAPRGHDLSLLYNSHLHCITLICIALVVGTFFGCFLTGCIQMLTGRNRSCICCPSKWKHSGVTDSHTRPEDMKERTYPLSPEFYDVLPVRKGMPTSSRRSTPSQGCAIHRHSKCASIYYSQLVGQRHGQAVDMIPIYPNNGGLPMNTHAMSDQLPYGHANRSVWNPANGQPPPLVPAQQTVFGPDYPDATGSVYSLIDNALPTRRRAGSEITKTPKNRQRSHNRSVM